MRAAPRCAACKLLTALRMGRHDGTVRLTRDTCTPASDQFGPTQNARSPLLFSVECRVTGAAAGAGGREAVVAIDTGRRE